MLPVETVDSSTAVNFSIAVVDQDPRLRTMIAMQLGESAQASSFPSLEVVEDRTASSTPMVLVMGPSMANEAGLAEYARAARTRPALSAVLVAQELSTALLQQANGLRATDWDDANALVDEIAAPACSEGLQCDLIADPFDEHDGTGIADSRERPFRRLRSDALAVAIATGAPAADR